VSIDSTGNLEPAVESLCSFVRIPSLEFAVELIFVQFSTMAEEAGAIVDDRVNDSTAGSDGEESTSDESTENLDDINMYIDDQKAALEATSSGDADRAAILHNIGLALLERHKLTRESHEITKAVEHIDLAIESAANESDRSQYLQSLSNSFQTRYFLSPIQEDLDAMIKALKHSVQLTPLEESVNKANRLRDLGLAYRERFFKTSCAEYINSAIDAHSQALELIQDGDDTYAQTIALSDLGLALKYRLQPKLEDAGSAATDDPGLGEDIDAMADRFREAAHLSSEDDPDRALYLSNLGYVLLWRHRRNPSSISDINEAITAFEGVSLRLSEHDLARGTALSDYADALEARFEKTGSDIDLDKEIVALEEVTRLTADQFPAEPIHLNHLGNILHARFDLKNNVNDLNESILARNKAVELTPVDYEGREFPLADLGKGLIARYELLGRADDLNSAINAFRTAVQKVSKDGSLYSPTLNQLSCALRTQFETTGELDSLNGAIESTKKLLELELDLDERVITLSNLGACFQNLFETNGTIATLEEALKYQRAAAELAPSGAPTRPVTIAGLAESLRKRYDVLGSPEDLDGAIALGEEAVAAPGLDQTNPNEYPLMLTNLGLAFSRRYEILGGLEDLENSVKYCKQAEKQSSMNPLLHPLCSSNYSYCLLSRYYYSGIAGDIDEAVIAAKAAVSTDQDRLLPVAQNNLCRASILKMRLSGTTEESLDDILAMSDNMLLSVPPEHIQRPMVLNCQGLVLIEMFQRTGSSKHLDMLVETLDKAATASKSNNKEVRAIYLKDLAEGLLTRFEWTGKQDDLDKGFDTAARAMELVSEIHPQFAVHLITKGRAFLQRAIHASSVEDINSAIKIFEQAGRQIRDQHPQRPVCMNNLATALGMRFALLGTTDDLNAAIQAAMGATKSLSMNSPDKAICLSNLGQILAHRFSRNGRDDDIDIAVDSHSTALEITATGNWRYVEFLNNLSSVLMMRYHKHSRPEDLDHAVRGFRMALTIAPKDNSEKPRYLTNLSAALLEVVKSKTSDEAVDDTLDEAIRNSKAAVELSMGDESQRRSEILFMYGSCLETRFKRSKNPLHGLSAVETFQEILDSPRFPVVRRVAAAIQAAHILYPDDIPLASQKLSLAVELLPKIISRSLLRNDQQYVLSQISGLAADAAALAIRDDQSSNEALRLLELGRGLIANLYIGGRVDITDLDKAPPELAVKFRAARSKLDIVEEDILLPGVKSFLQSQAARRYEVIQEFDNTVAMIQGTPGFDHFLKGPSSNELRTYATNGSIVYLNPSRFGAVALIVTKKDIHHISLPKLSYEELTGKAQQLTDIRDNDDPTRRRQNNMALRKILEWLWDVAIEEVLNFLGFTGMPGSEESWPKIWWIPVGMLSLFPIHAAGRRANGASAIDRVISCYATTARSLGLSRDKISALAIEQSIGDVSTQNICLVRMSETPDRTDLTHAKAEIEAIEKLLAVKNEIMATENLPPLSKTVLPQPAKRQVMESLRHCSIVHFACHGEMDSNPSYSRILFTDWEEDPFLVQNMGTTGLSRWAQLAYLSACHAGTSKDMFLLDEAMHMTGACQLAGFPAVVGTLWKVLDEYAPVFADDIYTAMLNGNTLDVGQAARGLHFAMRKVKLLAEKPRGKDNPMAWAPYVYVGV
jgi:hypothetical protein